MPEIWHLRIERFRGIAQMEWVPKAGINAIVGPGDAAKSTILDAIEVVHRTVAGRSPRRTLPTWTLPGRWLST